MKRNWEEKKFEDCLERVVYTNKIQRRDFLEIGKFPIISQEQEFINGFWNDSNDLFKVKKPVIIFGDHTQVLKYIDFNFVLGADGVKILQPKDELNSKYFYYFLRSVEFKTLGYARHYRILKELSIFFPPLLEQKRIVTILDEAFAAIAKAKEKAEKNLQNARELFDSYLQSVFANPGDGWEEKRVDQLSENLDSKRKPVTKSKRKKGIYPYYGASGIVDYVDGYIFDEDLLLVSEDGANLIARSTPIAFSVSGKVWVNNHAHILRFKDLVTQKFVELFFASIRLDKYITGAAQPKLNQAALNSIIIPVPLLSEQRSIVAKLDALSAETKKLEAIYQKKLDSLDELKKSILQKAFNGEI